MQVKGHTFERLSDTDVRITYPDGHQEVKYYLAAENLMKKLQRADKPKPASRIYAPNSKEYLKLESFAKTLTAFGSSVCIVENTYLDYGAGTAWTTVIADKNTSMPYQLLSPTEQDEILNASYTEFSKIVSKNISKLKEKRKRYANLR